MKRILLISTFLLATLMVSAQTQQGFVKTKGRMVNGQHIPGEGLVGATVFVQDRTPIAVQSKDGSFSFPIPAQTFMVNKVEKSGYELVDADAIKKAYLYSGNPIYLVMETPEQQLQDQLTAERKIRRTLQKQLQEREDELEALRESHKITLEEYQSALQKLYEEQQSNESLIANMAKEYAQIDYDQMDDLNRRITDAIINGRLTEADSLLLSKGDINDRISNVRFKQQIEAQREQEIVQEQSILEESKIGTQKELEDIADDLLLYAKRYLTTRQLDSAQYYTELRANLDTTNAEWQEDAGVLFYNNFNKQELYYNRALKLYRELAKTNPQVYDAKVSGMLNSLASHYISGDAMLSLYGDLEDYQKTIQEDLGEALYKESLEICQRYAENDQNDYELYVATVGLANLYKETNRLKESELYYQKALNIYYVAKLKHIDDKRFSYVLPERLDTELGEIYALTNRPKDSETKYKNALSSYYSIDKSKAPSIVTEVNDTFSRLLSLYEKKNRFEDIASAFGEVAQYYQNLSNYYSDDEETLNTVVYYGIKCCFIFDNSINYIESTNNLELDILKRYNEVRENFYQVAYNYYTGLDEDHQSLFHHQELAEITRRMADYYWKNGRIVESIEIAKENVDLNRWLTSNFNKDYEINLADALHNLGFYSSETYVLTSENSYLEAIEIYRRWIKTNAEIEPSLALTLNNLANLYKSTNRLAESETPRKEAMEIYKRWTVKDPDTYEPKYAQSLLDIGVLYNDSQRFPEAQSSFSEAMTIYRSLSKSEPKTYDQNLFFSTHLLGTTLVQTGQLKESIPLFEEALKLSKKLITDEFDVRIMQCNILMILGNLYGNEKNYKKAYTLNQEMFPLMESLNSGQGNPMQNEYSNILSNQAFYALHLKKYAEAEQLASKAITLEPSNTISYTNLAVALLFQGKYNEAEAIYLQYKDELKDNFLQDLYEFEAAGVIPKERMADVGRIRKLLLE